MENLVVIRIASSGLGNLLFQLCGAEEVARRSGAVLRLDLDGVSGDQLTSVSSGAADKVLAIAEIWKTRGGWRGKSKLTRWLARLQVRLGLVRSGYFGTQSAYTYDERFNALRAPAYLDGYLINPRYFSAAVGDRVCAGDLSEFADLADAIGACNSVSIHVRRGDYCQLPGYPVYGIEYVAEAARLIEARAGDGEYFLFTDDVDWAKREIQLPGRKITLVSARTRAAWQDLELMRLCRHNIISNSTFSWWAGFRNANPDKVVVMPRHWHDKLDGAAAADLAQPGWLHI
jgi:hypothetical protein